MKIPHKHAEVIKAWADGADIEWRKPGDHEWSSDTTKIQPAFYNWSPDYEYRVKISPHVVVMQGGVATLEDDINIDLKEVLWFLFEHADTHLYGMLSRVIKMECTGSRSRGNRGECVSR